MPEAVHYPTPGAGLISMPRAPMSCEGIPMKRVPVFVLGGVLLAGWVAAPRGAIAQPDPTKGLAAEGRPTPEQTAFFEKRIRPVLVRECYACHAATAEKIKGGLTLDSREGTRKGGKTG